MKQLWIVPLLVMFSLCAKAQTPDPNQKEEGAVNPKFSIMTKEVSFLCGEFLPNQIQGMSELMALCGGRLGLKTGTKTTIEPMLVTGAAKGQKYILGSFSIRGDFQIDDLISSIYFGADIHYATTPIYSGLQTVGDETNLYFGGHLGGALWFDLADNLYFRTDLKFNLNPGTSLFIGFGLVLRFDPAGGPNQGQPNQ